MSVLPRLLIALAVATLVRVLTTAVAPGLADLVEPFVVAIIWIAVAERPLPAQLCGLVLGLCFDVFSGRPFGLGGFAGTLVGYLVARFAQHLLMRQPRTLALVFALAIATQQAVVAALEVLLVAAASVPDLERVAVRVLVSTALGITWSRAELALLDRFAGWRRDRNARIRLD